MLSLAAFTPLIGIRTFNTTRIFNVIIAIKTLRKPKDQIKEIMGSKPAARKYFDDIKAVGVKPKGRFNDQMIILKAF